MNIRIRVKMRISIEAEDVKKMRIKFPCNFYKPVQLVNVHEIYLSIMKGRVKNSIFQINISTCFSYKHPIQQEPSSVLHREYSSGQLRKSKQSILPKSLLFSVPHDYISWKILKYALTISFIRSQVE